MTLSKGRGNSTSGRIVQQSPLIPFWDFIFLGWG